MAILATFLLDFPERSTRIEDILTIVLRPAQLRLTYLPPPSIEFGMSNHAFSATCKLSALKLDRMLEFAWSRRFVMICPSLFATQFSKSLVVAASASCGNLSGNRANSGSAQIDHNRPSGSEWDNFIGSKGGER